MRSAQDVAVMAALGLAAYRGTQLIVWDSILDPARKRIEMWRVSKFDSRVRKFVWDLITCVYCTGFHVSWLTVLAYHVAAGWSGMSFLMFGLEVFTVAGVQALANRWDDSRPGHQPDTEGN
jgi:hypothetical protein